MSDIIDIETTEKIDRYPGIRPFKREEDILFFGRRTEVEELIHSIKVHNVFVIFSKSGLGKSSLINAGLIPRLYEEGMYPADIRFQNIEIDPREQIINEIKKYLPEAPVENDFKSFYQNLYYHLQHLGKNKIVLIFDQFEEFFFHKPEHRITIIKALSNLVGKLRFTGEEKTDNVIVNSGEQNNLDIKLIFAIRSDRISNLDEFTPYIPTILQNRYQLLPLSIDKAEKAIVLPAQLDRKGKTVFKTPPYFYDDNAIEVLLDALGKEQKEVESSQLQIVCQELERIANNLIEKEGRDTLTAEDFGGKEGITEIQNKFYQNQLNILKNDPELNFNDADILIIRRLIENELLSGNKRVSQSEGKVFEYLDKIKTEIVHTRGRTKTQVIVDKLLQLRLIRDEETHLGRVYEISHDTLVESIVKAKTERKSQEQIEELNQERTRQEEELIAEKKRYADMLQLKNLAETQRRKARTWLLVSSFALILSIFFGFYVFKSKKTIGEQKDKFKNVFNKVLMTEAEKNYSNGNDALAFRLFQISDKLTGKDSLLSSRYFVEFSGNDIKTDDSLNIVCCKYADNSLQICRLDKKNSKRQDILQIKNAQDFYFSNNGKTLVYTDTSAKAYHIVTFNTGEKNEPVIVKDTFSVALNNFSTDDSYQRFNLLSIDGSCFVSFKNDTMLLISTVNKKSLIINVAKTGYRAGSPVLQTDPDANFAIVSINYSGEKNETDNLWMVNLKNFELSKYDDYRLFYNASPGKPYIINKTGNIYAVRSFKKLDSVLHITFKKKLPDCKIMGDYLTIDYYNTVENNTSPIRSYFLIYDMKNKNYLIDPNSGTTRFLSTSSRLPNTANSTPYFFLFQNFNMESTEVFLPLEKRYKMVKIKSFLPAGSSMESYDYSVFIHDSTVFTGYIEDSVIKLINLNKQRSDSLIIPGFYKFQKSYNSIRYSGYSAKLYILNFWDSYFMVSMPNAMKAVIKIDPAKVSGPVDYWNSFYPDIDSTTKKSLGIDLLK